MLSTYTGVKATWEQTSTEIMTTHYLIPSAAQGNYPAKHFALRHTETIPKVQRSWTCIGPEQKPCCCSPIMPGLKMIHTGTHLSSLAQALCHANCMYRFQVKAALSSYLLQSLGNVNWHLSKTNMHQHHNAVPSFVDVGLCQLNLPCTDSSSHQTSRRTQDPQIQKRNRS